MEPVTRKEMLCSGVNLNPITRKEMYIAKMAGMDVETPEPITRKEIYMQKLIENGCSGGGGNLPEAETMLFG